MVNLLVQQRPTRFINSGILEAVMQHYKDDTLMVS